MKSNLALILLVAGPVFANSLKVTAVGTEKNSKVEVSFQTTKTFSSMCFLHIHSLSLVAPKDKDAGSIAVEAARDPNGVCLQAFGPHSGKLILTRGNSLPAISAGKYSLEINGEDYGTLEVDTNVTLTN